MLEGAKQRMMQKAMENVTPSETAVAQALAHVIAGLEHEQAQAMQRLVNAAEMDGDVHHDAEAREQQLLDLADAVAQDGLPEYYLAEVLDVDDPERALNHLDSDDWGQQKRAWYQQYRERGIVEGPAVDDATQDDIDHAAVLHVQEVFGVALAQFEQHVVRWDRGEAMQQLLAGPLVGHTELIDTVAREIEGDES